MNISTSSRRAVFAIAATAVRRLLRDRSNLFFVFVFPALLIVLIGVQFGGPQGFRLAVHAAEDAGPLADELLDSLAARPDLILDRYDSNAAALDSVSRGASDGAVLLPPGFDRALRSSLTAEVGFVATPQSAGPALRQVVSAVVAEQAQLLAAATLVVANSDENFDTGLDLARRSAVAVPGVTVDVVEVGRDQLADEFAGLGQFDLGAAQQLALFVFVTSLSAAAALIQSRELGVSSRLLASPLTPRDIISGELLGRFGVALLQALYIVLGSALVFGVRWGDPLGALLLVAMFSAVSAGAAMLLGSALDTPSQAAGIGVGVGLTVSALGGSMAPIEIFPPVMQTIALATPHAWLLDGFAELVRRDASLVDVLPQIGVLAAMAIAMLGLASMAFKRKLT